MNIIRSDDSQDENDEIQEVKDFIRLFRQVLNEQSIMHNGIMNMSYYKYAKEFLRLTNKKVLHVTVVGYYAYSRTNADFNDPNIWKVTIQSNEEIPKTYVLTYFQAKIVCPHILSFFMLIRYPKWVKKYKIWRWCADRRMVPIGDK